MRYFVVLEDGQKYGPAEIALINEWATEGRIAVDTVLEEEGTGNKITAGELPEIRRELLAPAENDSPAVEDSFSRWATSRPLAEPAAPEENATLQEPVAFDTEVSEESKTHEERFDHEECALPEEEETLSDEDDSGVEYDLDLDEEEEAPEQIVFSVDKTWDHVEEPEPPVYETVPPRPMTNPVEFDSKQMDEVSTSYVVSCITAMCCPIVGPLVGYALAQNAERKGKPGAQAAKTFAIVMLIISIVFAFYNCSNR